MDNFKVYAHIAPNNKLYIGITKDSVVHRWGVDGSGYKNQQLFYRAIKKYGWSNFKHLIILDNLSKDVACMVEQYLIDKYNTTNNEKGYNVALGGDGPFGVIRSAETRQKIREFNLGRHHTEETKLKISKNHSRHNKGMKLSKERAEKLHNSRRGKPSWNSGKKLSVEYRKKLSESHKGQVAWNKGIPMSEETKIKCSNSHKGQVAWNKGTKMSDNMKKQISESLKGRVWVNNGINRTLIPKIELDNYISKGYVLGKKF